MASPFAYPRTGQLYSQRAVPEALRPAFDGKAEHKISLKTKDPAAAKVGFARENAAFEARLAEARRWIAEGTLAPTPAALMRRWCEGPAVDGGLTGPQRLVMMFMELAAAAAGSCRSVNPVAIYRAAVLGPATNTNGSNVLVDRERFASILADVYGDEIEQAGSNLIRLRWHEPEHAWRYCLDRVVARLRAFDAEAARFFDEEIAKALLTTIHEKMSGDEEKNRERLAYQRPRATQPRVRPRIP